MVYEKSICIFSGGVVMKNSRIISENEANQGKQRKVNENRLKCTHINEFHEILCVKTKNPPENIQIDFS